MTTRQPSLWLAILFLLAAHVAPAEIITLGDDGGASESSEDALLHDTYARSNDEMRGRFGDKLYATRNFQGETNISISAVQFVGLKERLGEHRRIVKATLRLVVTNASGPKPIECIAYPFIEEWSYDRFSWSTRLVDKTRHHWNTDPQGLNPEPASDSDADVATYDFTKRHQGKIISATGEREISGVSTLAPEETAVFDVTDVVRLWVDGDLPNYGWALVAPNEGSYLRFWASNGEGTGPTLVVEVE
ncbi:MAG: DNRLRE domain-containing protein [Verrucomicrobia bacterium]|nr:DNRLRE domain-containing protein [Verrucomicrobiota bacterium]